jgi:hypothetical protein
LQSGISAVPPLVAAVAAETILGYFGFDRTIYRDTIKKKNRKWWYELSQEHRKDIETERNVHDGWTEEDPFST